MLKKLLLGHYFRAQLNGKPIAANPDDCDGHCARSTEKTTESCSKPFIGCLNTPIWCNGKRFLESYHKVCAVWTSISRRVEPRFPPFPAISHDFPILLQKWDHVCGRSHDAFWWSETVLEASRMIIDSHKDIIEWVGSSLPSKYHVSLRSGCWCDSP